MATEDEHDPQPAGPEGRRLVAVDAFIDLVLEGEVVPTPDDVAARAGVSRATFFRYFTNLVELRNEAARRVGERFPDLFVVPAAATLDQRIDRLVDARLRLHEQLHRLELLMRAHAARDAESAAFVDVARQVLAEQVREHFAPDLAPHGPAERDDIVAAIAVLTSVESWQQFRQSHGRSVAQTRRAWRAALAGVLSEDRRRPGG